MIFVIFFRPAASFARLCLDSSEYVDSSLPSVPLHPGCFFSSLGACCCGIAMYFELR